MSAPSGLPSNPFEVLGLDRSASFEEVKGAYRRLARQHHPDANPNDPDALERFTTLRRAYDRLKIFYQTLDHVAPAPGMTAATLGAEAATTPGVDATSSVRASGGRDIVPEPTVPGTSGRRAFYRSGALRQEFTSGQIGAGPAVARGDSTGARAATGGVARSEQSAQSVPGTRAPRVNLPAPVLFGSGHMAARAEVLLGHPDAPVGDNSWMYYVLLSVRASESVVFPRVPLNLCLVLDHSSSMLRGGKVDRLKETVRGIIDQLDEDDYLAIVTFGDRAEVLLPAQPLRNKDMVRSAIESIHCRGGTEISRGLAAGLSELSRNASRALSHLILLTDGQTRGDEMACLERTGEAVAMSAGITAYGLGADWNSALLDGIAAPTGGYSDYIDAPEAMIQAFAARVLTLQSTTLHKVTMEVRMAGERAAHTLQRATVVSPMLRPLDGTASSGGVSVLGDLSGVTDHKVLLEFALGPRRAGTVDIATMTLRYDVPGLRRSDETLTVPLVVTARTDYDAAATPDPRVTAALRHVTIHRLQQQAWVELTGTGNVARGTGLLKRAAEHLEAVGRQDLAKVMDDEVARIANGQGASDENIKRIIYGTRKLA
jgi:Ca-activated chloride channel family protein